MDYLPCCILLINLMWCLNLITQLELLYPTIEHDSVRNLCGKTFESQFSCIHSCTVPFHKQHQSLSSKFIFTFPKIKEQNIAYFLPSSLLEPIKKNILSVLTNLRKLILIWQLKITIKCNLFEWSQLKVNLNVLNPFMHGTELIGHDFNQL